MDIKSLYSNQLHREDLKSDPKSVVKWSYVNSETHPGKFLIVTCKWSTKLWKYFESMVLKNKNPIISPMFRAGNNNELKWELTLEPKNKFVLRCNCDVFTKNDMKYDLMISLLKNDLSMKKIWSFDGYFTDEPQIAGELEHFRDECLGRDGNVITIVQGFIVDVTEFQDNELPVVPSNSNAVESVLKQLLENPLFSDVTLIIGEERLQAHKNILAVNSPVFHEILEGYKEKESCVTIEINDFQFDTIKEMLHFMYTSELRNYGEESTKQILLVSSKYAIKNLFLKSEQALLNYLNVKNAIEFLKLAGDVNAENIKLKSIDVILNNIEEIDPSALSVLRPELLRAIFETMSHKKKKKLAFDYLDNMFARLTAKFVDHH